ncbi:mATE efflux family protein [Clostridium sp. CAG:242]|nr:mATE efflux family protein [Clostridium sp. CAG:242]
MQTRTIDLTRGSIMKALLLFAVPLFISNLFQQLYNTADTMIVGNVLGDQSLAVGRSVPRRYRLHLRRV